MAAARKILPGEVVAPPPPPVSLVRVEAIPVGRVRPGLPVIAPRIVPDRQEVVDRVHRDGPIRRLNG